MEFYKLLTNSVVGPFNSGTQEVFMIHSEPFKIKEVKHLPHIEPYERWNLLKNSGFNLLKVSSDHVTFDLTAQGMSSWSHFQKAGYQIGDEAYAGSRNYRRLTETASAVLDLKHLVPTHNGLGAEKLLVTTMLRPGQMVLHNRGRCDGLVPFCGGKSVDVTGEKALKYREPGRFGADLDLNRIEFFLNERGRGGIAYIQVTLCPEDWCGQTVSMENLESVYKLGKTNQVPVAVDISNILENALCIHKAAARSTKSLLDTVRKIIAGADIILMDASQDCRADVGGFVTSNNEEIFNKLRNQVVVFEGLHTYGGMTGRAMEVFAVGMDEMRRVEYTEWYDSQIELLYTLIKGKGVPVIRGTRGIGLNVSAFLPHMSEDDHPKFVLASSLFIGGGIRPRIAGGSEYHISGEGRRVLTLELPRHAYTRSHL